MAINDPGPSGPLCATPLANFSYSLKTRGGEQHWLTAEQMFQRLGSRTVKKMAQTGRELHFVFIDGGELVVSLTSDGAHVSYTL